MRVIPAIDIKNGRCVRLQQGDPHRETVYTESPVDQAKTFEDAGAELIHVVDLDGAFQGAPVSIDIVASIADAVSCEVEIGGGIRTVEDVASYVDRGIERIILGSVILKDAFAEIAEKYKKYIVAGVDARDGYVSTDGWLETSEMTDEKIIEHVKDHGIHEVIYTDIATDGMLQGPSYGHLERLLKKFPQVSLVASGGISSLEDIIKLAALPYGNLTGCITGKAIYDGRLDVAEAVKRVKD